MKTLGVIFGGVSPEHDVSITSGLSVIKNLDKEKYNIKQIYIDTDGTWYEHKKFIEPGNVGETREKLKGNCQKIENVTQTLNELNIIFPVLHGKNGEDGTMQGLFELMGKKYVGCGVLASSIGMDKAYTKIIFEKANIPQAKYVYIREYNGKYIYIDKQFNETIHSSTEIVQKIAEKLKFPMFVKPSNSGSSVGINKAKNTQELEEYIKIAATYDKKIVIEEGIVGRELECAVLGNEDVKASGIGEILPADDFYSFDAKYKNAETKTVTNANIPEEVKERMKKLAIKGFKAIDGKGLSRVDFFWNEENNIIYINEINTLPGFTQISMYAKLWEEAGINYSDLLEELIDLAETK